jgi:hypothetical protein
VPRSDIGAALAVIEVIVFLNWRDRRKISQVLSGKKILFVAISSKSASCS